MRRLAIALAGLALAAPVPARAHHGGAAMGIAGPEGPGAALETTSALLPQERNLLLFAKTEYVPFQQFSWADPTNKEHFWFNTLTAGYGITPWLTVFLSQPLQVKAQQTLGTSAGLADTNVGLAFGFKYDEGFRLVPEKESLDDLMDWHFTVWASCTLPVGRTTRIDAEGDYFEPEMQSGFGSPSPTAGLAVLKQISADFTWLFDASYQAFFPHTYPFTRYQFGGETRVDSALVWRAVAARNFRLDLAVEANFLNLQRDKEQDAAGQLPPLEGSGGSILYLGGGVRAYWGRLSGSIGMRGPVWKNLNEQWVQQGSEGLELFRLSAAVSYVFGL